MAKRMRIADTLRNHVDSPARRSDPYACPAGRRRHLAPAPPQHPGAAYPDQNRRCQRRGGTGAAEARGDPRRPRLRPGAGGLDRGPARRLAGGGAVPRRHGAAADGRAAPLRPAAKRRQARQAGGRPARSAGHGDEIRRARQALADRRGAARNRRAGGNARRAGRPADPPPRHPRHLDPLGKLFDGGRLVFFLAPHPRAAAGARLCRGARDRPSQRDETRRALLAPGRRTGRRSESRTRLAQPQWQPAQALRVENRCRAIRRQRSSW